MADPLATTFKVLTSTNNAFAVEALIPALDVRNEQIRTQALKALISRPNARGHIEIIRRLETLSPELRVIAEKATRQLSPALRQCIVHGDDQLRTNSLEFSRKTDNYDQVETLVEILSSKRNSAMHDEAAETMRFLVNSLYDRVRPDPENPGSNRDYASPIKQKILLSLHTACSHISEIAHPSDVVESLLILGDMEDFAVKAAFTQGPQECRELATQALQQSVHPGVMQLICDSMSERFPLPRVFEVLATRNDPEFVQHVLRWMPQKPSQRQQRNLKQIKDVCWLDPEQPMLVQLPEHLQANAARLITATGIDREKKRALQEVLVRGGGQGGRMAVSDVLADMDPAAIREVIFRALASDDPGVQVWATGQLRNQGIPEAFRLLVSRLDSPIDAVRDAARSELSSFNVPSMIEMYDHFDADNCRRAGELLQKIDPDCSAKLRREMANPIRRKRIRAARAAEAMGMQTQVLPALTVMLDDTDPLVRRTSVEVLSGILIPEVVRMLQNLSDDPSPRVRDAVMKALSSVGEPRE